MFRLYLSVWTLRFALVRAVLPPNSGNVGSPTTVQMERFQHFPGRRLSSVVMRNKTRDVMHCCYTCYTEDWCQAVNFNSTSGDCDRSNNKFSFEPDPNSDVYITFSETDCFKDSCYWPVLEPMDYSKAQTYCETLGGHLADIQTEDEDNFIKEFLKQPALSEYIYSPGNVFTLEGGCIIFGATDEAVEGDWQWTDGSDVSAVYQNWGSGQPQNVRSENCVCYYTLDLWRWHDIGCFLELRAVCEYSA